MLGRFAAVVSLTAALICALPSCGHGQSAGAVIGTVTDPDDHPLSGVVVSIQGLGLSVATTAAGRYVLPRVPTGQHVLRFHRIGYAPYETRIDVTVAAGLTIDAILDPEPIELGSVLVEGVSRAPDRMIDAPAAVEVMRPTTAEPQSLTGQIPLALSRVPGLDVAEGGVTDFNVNARGFNTMLSRKLLVLQDGRDLGTGTLGSQIWGALSEPLEDVGRIEVIRGPASALYGPNAYNGVINITTPSARDVIGTKVTLGGGELGTARADLRQAGVWLHDRLGYRVNFGYTRSEDWARSRTARDGSDWKEEYAPATATPPMPSPEQLPLIGQTKDTVTGRALGTPNPVESLYGSARVDYYGAHGSIVTLEGGTARVDNSVTVGGSGRSQSPRLLRPWARFAWDANGSSVSAWYSGLSWPMVSLGAGKRLENEESVFHLEGRTSRTFHRDAGRVVVGASAQDDKVMATVIGPNDRSDQYYGAFAQLEYGVGQRVRVIGAMRWDGSDLFRARLSPKGTLVVIPARNHALHLKVDRAFLAPGVITLFGGRPVGSVNLSAIEAQLRASASVGPALNSVPFGKLFDSSAAVPESSFGNAHLMPQTVTSYEVGYKGQLGWRAFITLDAYDAHIENFLTGLLPAGTTGINPAYLPWTPPPEVPTASWAAVESAAESALARLSPVVANGLTRLRDGRTAVVLSFGNVGVVDEWGVELGGSVSLTRALTVTASYTWYNFAIRRHVLGDVLAPNTPGNKATVAVDYANRDGIDLGVDVHLVGGFRWSTGKLIGLVPASQTVDLSARYRVNPHLRLFANGTDVLNQRRFEAYGGAVIGRRVLVGVTSTF